MRSSVDIATVSDLNCCNDQCRVVDLVNDPVISGTDTPQIVFALQFLATLRPRVISEGEQLSFKLLEKGRRDTV